MAEGTSKLYNRVFGKESARQTSFFAYDWPHNATVSPVLLVRSGFYYQGKDQDVTCFYCGLTTSVKDWTRNMYPQQIHLKLSPDCHFIQSKHAKGRSQTFNVVSHDSCTDVVSHDSCSDVVSHDNCFDFVSRISATDRTESSILSDSGPPELMSRECLLISGSTPFPYRTSQSHGNSYLPGSFLSTNAKAVPDGTSTTASMQSSFASAEFQSAIARPENLNYKHPEMETVTKRTDTFVTWPHKHIQEPGILVSAGFYYTMDHDIVRCFSCDLGLSEWDENDNPWTEHARHSPNCGYLKRVKGQNFIDDIQKDRRKIYNPKFPNLIDEEDRMKTFNNWPNCISKPPLIDIARAGFFYTGRGDECICHYCDGRLKNWESGDNPLEQHAYYFPFCKFVIKLKGREFISDIRERFEFPNLIDEEDRIETFNNWPNGIVRPPSIDIAKVGFFFTGRGDECRYQYRDKGLQHWENGYNPLEHHAYYFPFRKFVLKRKGREFISNIRDRFVASAPNVDALMRESEEAEEQQNVDINYLLVISNKQLGTNAELRDKLAKLEKKYQDTLDTLEESLTSQLQLTRSIEQLEAEKRDLTVLLEKKNKEDLTVVLEKKNKELDQLKVYMQALNEEVEGLRSRLNYVTYSNNEHMQSMRTLTKENKTLRDIICQRKKESLLTD